MSYFHFLCSMFIITLGAFSSFRSPKSRTIIFNNSLLSLMCVLCLYFYQLYVKKKEYPKILLSKWNFLGIKLNQIKNSVRQLLVKLADTLLYLPEVIQSKPRAGLLGPVRGRCPTTPDGEGTSAFHTSHFSSSPLAWPWLFLWIQIYPTKKKQ